MCGGGAITIGARPYKDRGVSLVISKSTLASRNRLHLDVQWVWFSSY